MTVLVVEDEPLIRESQVAYLKNEGFKVIEAETGTKALSIFKKETIDCLVLDLNIPGIDGISLCKEIRKSSNVPIIMVTARISDADELLGLNIGADDYLKKPFNPKVLVARVNTILKRKKEFIKSKYIDIDPEKQIVYVKGKQIELTSTEFSILNTLFKNPGKVFNREEMLLKAYPDYKGNDILDRTIDVHIKNIRKKLKIYKNLPEFILTAIGKGYKFNENL